MAGMLGVSADATAPLAEMVIVTLQWGRLESVAVVRQHLAIGPKRAGRDPEDLQLIFRATAIIRSDQQEAREMARSLCLQRPVEKAHAPYLRAAGIDDADLETPVAELSGL